MKNLVFKNLLLAVMLLCSAVANAQDYDEIIKFENNGIWYEVNPFELDEEGYMVAGVTSCEDGEYSGSVYIPSYAFYNGVTYSVTRIFTHAFSDCPNLTEVFIDNNKLTSIDAYAFSYSKNLKSVTIPNSVITIETGAFYECSGLTSIIIPGSVTSIGSNVFDGCGGLTSIIVDESNTVYDSRNNCNAIIETATNTLIKGSNNTIIPNSVTSIENYAFYNCNGLTSVTIPNGITSIGSYVFGNCSSLANVEIPNSVTSIRDYAFRGCSSLTSIEIPNSITSIGGSAFAGCSGLASITIPSSVTTIGKSAFIDCRGLKNIAVDENNTVYDSRSNCNAIIETASNTLISGCKSTIIPESVTSIGERAFNGCDGLTSITIPNSVESIGSYAFRGCSALTSVEIPNSITSIESSIFYGCSSLTEVTIPNSVISIGGNAFEDCTSLSRITIPNSVTKIDGRAFYGCSGLTSITIPNSVTYIGGSAFSGCSSLSDIVIPNSVSIGLGAFDGTKWYENMPDGVVYLSSVLYDYKGVMPPNTNIIVKDGTRTITERAFVDCSNLTGITIPNSVTSIGSKAFSGCSSLANVELNCTTIFDWFRNNTAIKKVVLGNSVTSIRDYAFLGCSSLTSIEIPNSITSIGGSAFSGCSSLASIEISNSITSIGGSAFSGCSSLTSITIPSSVTTIGKSAFIDCSGLENIVVDENNTVYDSRNNCNAIIETATNTLIKGSNNTVIPNSVTSIGSSAFYNCSGLTSIEIPNNVTSIGSSAFSGCSGLTSISIPNSVESIGSNAFSGCSSLANVELNCTTIDDWFKNNTAIKKVVLGSDVTSIGSNAFSGCSGLTDITIPNSVTSIGSNAFSGCSGLANVELNCTTIDDWFRNNTAIKKVVLGSDVTSIRNYAFSNCSGLTSLTIGNGVTSIESFAFSNCSGLTSLTIGNGVTSIESYAFRGCSGLTSITIPNSVTSIGYYAFSGCSSLANVELNCTSIDVWFRYNTVIKKVVLGSDVTSIRNYAFEGCSGLTSITSLIPADKLFVPGDLAFAGVDKTNSTLYVPYGAKATYAATNGWKEFKNIVELEDDLPGLDWEVNDGVLTISGEGAMPNYTSGSATPWYSLRDNITSIVIEDGVTSVGDYAFDYLDEVVSVEIPASVVSLGYYAFNYCSSLSEIFWYGTQKFTLKKSYYNFKSHIFPNTPSVITVYYKDGAVVTQWTDPKFTKVLFDEAGDIRWTLNAGKLIVTGKGDTQFAYVDVWDEHRAEITTVELSGVAATVKDDKYVLSVDGKTLYFSVYTENVVIPDGITTIGEKAFYNLTVQTLTVPSSVQKIEDYAFFGGYSLTKVNAYPTAAPVLGEDVFDEAAKDLAILYVEVEGADYSSWAGYFMQLSVPEAKEGTFATGGTWNFSGSKLTIEGDAIPNCDAGATPWQNWLSSVTEIVVGDGVTSIGKNAFNGAVATKVFISSAVETVNDKAFATAPQGVVFTFGNNSKIESGALPTSGVTKNLVIEEPEYIDKSGNPYYSADDLFVNNSNSYDQITLKRTFTKETSGTIMLPFEYTNNSKTLKFYKLTAFDSRNTKITFEEQVILEANTPYLWKNNGSSDVVGITSEDVSLSSSAMKSPKTQTIDGWTMRGTYSEVKATPDVEGFDTNLWIYSSKGKFEAYQDFCYVDPYSAYFKGKKFSEIFPDASDGKASINAVCEGRSLSVEFVDLDGTTSIENVTIDGDGSIDFSQQDGVYYDLSGRRVENPTAGIYIVNGKKVLVK